jgi:hypothetical protein
MGINPPFSIACPRTVTSNLITTSPIEIMLLKEVLRKLRIILQGTLAADHQLAKQKK